MIGRDFKLQEQRGKWMKLDDKRWALASVHPSFVIRSRIGAVSTTPMRNLSPI
jgi:hypothetical protein